MAWVDIHVPGVRVFLKQGLLPLAQLVGVLIDIFRVNTEKGFLILERVDPESAIRLESGRSLTQTTFIRRNGSFGIARHYRAPWSQGLSQLGRFFRGDGRKGAHRQATQCKT
ncbi:hypothetical protein D3C78_535810 [compost metagenome]